MEVEPSRLRRRGGTSFAARRAARELGARERARVHLCHAVPKVIASCGLVVGRYIYH